MLEIYHIFISFNLSRVKRSSVFSWPFSWLFIALRIKPKVFILMNEVLYDLTLHLWFLLALLSRFYIQYWTSFISSDGFKIFSFISSTLFKSPAPLCRLMCVSACVNTHTHTHSNTHSYHLSISSSILRSHLECTHLYKPFLTLQLIWYTCYTLSLQWTHLLDFSLHNCNYLICHHLFAHLPSLPHWPELLFRKHVCFIHHEP